MSVESKMSTTTDFSQISNGSPSGHKKWPADEETQTNGGLLHSENQEQKRETDDSNLGCWGMIQTITLFGFLASVSAYMMRICLSVAIVAMKDDFEWDSYTQGVILGSFFYGYIFTNLAGGRAADYFGARIVVSISLVLVAIFTLLSPMAAKIDTKLFIAVRILEGLSQGIMFPAINSLIASWAPPVIRAKMSMRIYTGIFFGTIICLPLSGWLCSSTSLGGWPSVFYVMGSFSLVVGIAFFAIVRDDPTKCPNISPAEYKFLMENGSKDDQNSTKLSVPWKSLLTSKMFWIIVIAHSGNDFGFYMLITELPTYLHNMFGFDIASNGTISSLPYLGSWLFAMFYSTIIDHLTRKGKISVLNVRRLSMGIGSYGPALGMLVVCFVSGNTTLTICVLVIGGSLNSAIYSGYTCSLADISPNFAGTLMGISNTISTIPGFLAPLMVGAFTHDNHTIWAWRGVFLITFVIYAISVTPYVFFISTKIESWNNPNRGDANKKEDSKGELDGKNLLQNGHVI